MSTECNNVLEPDELCSPGVNGGQGWASTEFDTGRRLGYEYSRRLRWVQPLNSWFVYKDGRWKKEGLEESKAAAMAVCTAQIIDNAGDGIRTSTYLKNVLSQAKRWLAIDPACFDNDPFLLCCIDGVLSLRKDDCGTLLNHEPEYLMTMSTGVTLQQYCDAKGVVQLPEDWGWGFYEWENHLLYMTQNLEEEKGLEFRDFFARWSGTSLIGSQNHKPQHFLNMTGQGRNGKGVAAEARIAALGDYGFIGPIRLVTRKQSDHSTELASCEGRRLLIVEEVSMVQSAVVKDLTGGGTMTARRMRMDDVTFPKSWTLELNSNQPLNLQGESTKAIRRRRLVANLGDEIPGVLHRDGIVEALRAERDIVLCWMVYGLRRWHEDGGRSAGLNVPAWMRVEGEQQADDDDVIGALIAERYSKCSELSGGRVLGSAFVKAVNERRKESGFLPMTPASIYAYLRDAGYGVAVGHGNKTYINGLRIAELTFGDHMEQAGVGTYNEN